MSDDVETRVRAAYAHLAPDPACESDLAAALAAASQEAAPARGAWARRLAVPVAASLLVAGAWWWGTRSGGEGPAGPGDKESPSSVVTVRIAADGAAGYSLLLGPDRFNIGSKLSFSSPEKEIQAAKYFEQTFGTLAEGLPHAADGTSSLRVVLAPDATAKWTWVSRVLMAAVASNVADVVYASPADRAVTIAHPLPTDAVLRPAAAGTVTWRVVLRTADGTDCARLATDGCAVEVSFPGGEKSRGSLLVDGTTHYYKELWFGREPAPAAPTESVSERVLEARRRSKETLDSLVAAARSVVSRPAHVVGEVDAPWRGEDASCVPYGAVFDVLAAMKAAGIETVNFSSPLGPPRKPEPPKSNDANSQLLQKRIRGAQFENATIGQVATYLSTVTGLNFIVSPKAGELSVKVSVPKIDDTSVRELLDLVTQPNGLRWRLRDYGVVEIRAESEATSEGR